LYHYDVAEAIDQVGEEEEEEVDDILSEATALGDDIAAEAATKEPVSPQLQGSAGKKGKKNKNKN
jgi:hypothetical protein